MHIIVLLHFGLPIFWCSIAKFHLINSKYMKNKSNRWVTMALLAVTTSIMTIAWSCEKIEPTTEAETETTTQAQLKSAVSITNPGFESSFTGWTDTDPSAISSDSHSGSKSAKITGSGGKFTQNVSVSANTNYSLSAYVKGTWRIGVLVNGTKTSRSGTTSSWKQEKVTFNSGSATTITIYAEYKSGEGRYDDFALESTGSSDGGGTTPGTANYPSDLMRNYKQWKITYPDGSEEKNLYQKSNEYFLVNGNKDAIVFKVPIRSNNGSTANSSYIRSELRERTADGNADIYWTTSGKHVVYVKQAITHLPIVKKHLVATQIHGDKSAGIDDAMVLRLESSHLFLSFNGGKLRSNVTIKTNYTLGKVHEVIFEVINGKHYCYYSEDGNLQSAYLSGNASQYLVKDGSNSYVMNKSYDQSYFKVGNYTQSNPDKEGSYTNNVNNYGEVLVYDFWVLHQ